MDLLLHFKVNEGDENNINIQEYMLYGDVETKSEKCLVDEGDEVVLTEFPVPEFKNCTLMKKGDEGFYEYKDYRQGENAELAGGYAVSGILQQNKRFDFKNKKQDKGYIDHDSKGLTICVSSKDSASLFKDSESKTFSWADVSSRIERLIATGKYFTDEEMEHYNSMNKDEILPAWLLEKCGLSDYTKNSQAMERPDWMEEHEILIDRDNDYVLLRDPDENVKEIWTASGEFLSTVQLENETVDEAMEEYYYNISKGDIEL